MKRVISLLTILILLVCLFAGCQSVNTKTTVVLEADSSVQLNLQGKTVKETDAALDGKKLDAAIATVISNMIQNGELSDESNTVLVTVNDADLQQTALNAVTKAFEAQAFAGAVICQTSEDPTQGKAALADSINAALNYNATALNELNVNDLLLLCQAKEAELTGVTYAGTASLVAYIDENLALDIVLAEAELEPEAASYVTITLDFSDYLFYDVKFTANGTAMEAYVEAYTGKLLYSGVVGGDRTDDDAEANITEEAAIAAACISVGADTSAIQDLKCNYVETSPHAYYDITFTYQETPYAVQIAASTGLPLEGSTAVDETAPDQEDDSTSASAEEGSSSSQSEDVSAPDNSGIQEDNSSDDAVVDG